MAFKQWKEQTVVAGVIVLAAVFGGRTSSVDAQPVMQHVPTVIVNPLVKQAQKYRACIMHRESRHNYKSRNHIAFGAYQFTRQAWNITAKRASFTRLIGVRPDRATPAQQDAMYFAAWKHGNGKFYWSARFGGPQSYACFPHDTRLMRSK